jgi:hypothetical protein
MHLNMHLDNLLKYLRESHYIHPAFFIVNILALIISIKSKYKDSRLNIFSYYFAAFIVLNLLVFLGYLFPSNETSLLARYFDFSFTLFEYILFAALIKQEIINDSKKKILFYNTILFISVWVALFVRDTIIYGRLLSESTHTLFIFQSFSLILCCTFYFIQIVNHRVTELKNTAAFWIITGLSVFHVTSLPVSFFLTDFLKNDFKTYIYLFPIFHVLYMVLFVMIIISFRYGTEFRMAHTYSRDILQPIKQEVG